MWCLGLNWGAVHAKRELFIPWNSSLFFFLHVLTICSGVQGFVCGARDHLTVGHIQSKSLNPCIISLVSNCRVIIGLKPKSDSLSLVSLLELAFLSAISTLDFEFREAWSQHPVCFYITHCCLNVASSPFSCLQRPPLPPLQGQGLAPSSPTAFRPRLLLTQGCG